MPEKVKITVWGYRCERCGHEWVPLRPTPPRVCARCKSAYWDTPKRRTAPPRTGEGARDE